MASNVSTMLVKVNIEEIRNNFTKPEFWQKSWPIFRQGNKTYSMRIERIECASGYIIMRVTNDDYSFAFLDEYFTVPCDHPEYTQEKFSMDIEHAILKILESETRSMLMRTDEYRKLAEKKNAINEQLAAKAYKLMDSIGEKRFKVRDMYLNAVQEYYWSEHVDPTDAYLTKNTYTYKPHRYLLALSWFGNEKVTKRYMEEKLNDDKIVSYLEKVETMRKELDDEMFVKEVLNKALTSMEEEED